jgi:hypothetical protein
MRELLEIFQEMRTYLLLPGGLTLCRAYLSRNSMGMDICLISDMGPLSSSNYDYNGRIVGFHDIIDFLDFCDLLEETELRLEELILISV